MWNKKVLKRHLTLILLIFSVGCLRLLFENLLHWPCGFVTSVVFVSFYCYWIWSCRQRFSQKRVRQMISAIGFFVIVFNLLRLLRVDFCMTNSVPSRYVWYLYYVPVTLLPTLNFHAMLYVGRPDSAAPSRWWNLLYVPVALMSAGVLTNDLHQLAFRFPEDMEKWDWLYTHGPLFQIITAWVVVLSLLVYFVLIKSCINRRLYRNLWLPALVAILGLVYRLNYSFYTAYDVGDRFFLQGMYELPELMGIIWIAVWESAVSSRVLPSNRGYLDFLEVSSLRAGITNGSFAVSWRFGDTLRPTEAQLRAAANGAITLENGDTVLKARPVRGGWFYWSEDMRALNALNEALEDTSDYLLEENAMLQQAAEIEEGRRRTLHQTRLYDEISLRIRPRLDQLNELLQNVPEEEAAFERMLARSAVIYAFLKRFSNLLLFADENGGASSDDLLQCLRESTRALRQLGVKCTLNVSEGMALPGKTAADLYEIFELLLEGVLTGLSEVRVGLAPQNEENVFVVEYGALNDPADLDGMHEDILACAQLLGTAAFSAKADGGRLSVVFGREADVI